MHILYICIFINIPIIMESKPIKYIFKKVIKWLTGIIYFGSKKVVIKVCIYQHMPAVCGHVWSMCVRMCVYPPF